MSTFEPMSMSNAKCETLSTFAEIARAIGNEHRLELLNLLAQGERCVERLAQITGLSVANASQHLQLMRRVGIVRSRRDGKNVRYRISDPSVLEMIAALHSVGEHTSDHVRAVKGDYFEVRDEESGLTPGELVTLLDGGDISVVDVRPEDEYAFGHIPGAMNIPFCDLASRMMELKPCRRLVTYGRGPYCVTAFESVSTLRAAGFEAQRYAGGVPAWIAAGQRIECGH